MTHIDFVTPFILWVVGVLAAVLMSVIEHKRNVRNGTASDREFEDAKRYFLPATADDEDAVRRLDFLRHLDCVYDRPTYALGEVPLRLHDGDC